MLPGDDWKIAISKAIRKCEYFIALLSSKSVSKEGYVHKEIREALERLDSFPNSKIFILPVRIDECEPDHERLKDLHWADLFPSYDNGLKEIFRVLQPEKKEQQKKSDFQTCTENYVHFTDRKMEIAKTYGENALPRIIFEAPSGYGKTKLLKKIAYKHFHDKWVCMYIAIPENVTSAFELGCIIAQQGGFHYVDEYSDIEALALMTSGTLKNRVAKTGAPGAVLLIDCIERLSKDEIETFFKSFIRSMQQSFTLKIYLAGRYTGSPWKKQADKYFFELQTLRLFNFNDVKNILKSVFPDIQSPEHYAAYLTHITNGHPGCIEKIINSNFKNIMESQTEPDDRIFKQDILAVSNAVRNTMPESLQNILDVLSVFRHVNLRILKKILRLNLADYRDSADRLERDLTVSYFMERKEKGFLQDNITRSLLANRLRLEKPEQYILFCEKAVSIYENELLNPSMPNPERMALECIYHTLQLAYFKTDQTNQDRKKLYNDFFSENGILNRYLHFIIQKPNAPEGKSDFFSLLADKGDEYDWEFPFSVNFFLRSDQYSNAPYETMIQRVKDFFKKH